MRGLDAEEAAVLQVVSARGGKPCDALCYEVGGPRDCESHFGREVFTRLADRGLIDGRECSRRDDVLHVMLTPRGRLALALHAIVQAHGGASP